MVERGGRGEAPTSGRGVERSEREDEFTPEERRALDAWRVGGAPDVTERVLARLEPEPEPKSRRSLRVGVAVVALLAAAVVGSFTIRSRPHGASYLAEHRMSAPIAGRAVAVMEAGAQLSFRDGGGATEVEQSAGNVFYRVDRGDPFLVKTALGTVTVLGTCFRVEVLMNSKTAGGVGAGVGAVLASAVLVTVYEGRVVTASPGHDETVALEAGESAEIATGRAPVKRTGMMIGGAPHSPDVGEDAHTMLNQRGLDPAQLPERVAVLAREKAALEQTVDQLKQQLEEAKGKQRETRMYDIDPAELKQMADNCELRWDVPGMGQLPDKISSETLSKLELSESERDVIDRNFARSHARLIDAIRSSYAAVTGDDDTGSMSAESMFAEIKDKTPNAELRRIFQQLSRERAGLVPPAEPQTPAERMFRAITGEGDRLEQALGTDLGPETARAIRDANKGWGDRHRSRYGCPGEP